MSYCQFICSWLKCLECSNSLYLRNKTDGCLMKVGVFTLNIKQFKNGIDIEATLYEKLKHFRYKFQGTSLLGLGYLAAC